jgi:hypothetical protein
MRKVIFIPIAIMLFAYVLAGCGSRKGDSVGSVAEVDVEYLHRDTTLYGVCGKATTMNTLQLISDMGDTIIISIAKAQERGDVYGGIRVGDRMAVLPNVDSTEAISVINISGMLGNWVMEDAIDGGNEVGICFKDGGVAESINHTNIQYKSWRLNNGVLEIVNTRDDGGDFEEIGYYHITYMGPDSLVFKEVTRPETAGREDVFEYSRQKKEEHYDPGFELEDADFEDFVF